MEASGRLSLVRSVLMRAKFSLVRLGKEGEKPSQHERFVVNLVESYQMVV